MREEHAVLYEEGRDFANCYRAGQLEELRRLIQARREAANEKRREYFQCDYSSIDTYLKSTERYRAELIGMLGWPLNEYKGDMPLPQAQVSFVAEDSLGRIFRLHIPVMEGVTAYGLLFLPPSPPPWPLVISQHGGGGTPELCSGFFDSGNYNDMTRRVLKKGCAVFAPQLLLWGEEFGPKVDNNEIDTNLKQLGGSLAALEVFKLMRSIDYLHSRGDIMLDKTGMMGLSYGGFYTLMTAAVDVRIKAALSSCFFNNRIVYGWGDWVWFGSGSKFLDSELCSLICPRRLYIEVADKDELLDVALARAEIKKVRETYGKLGYADYLRYKELDGVHELDKDDAGIEFLYRSLI